MTILFFILALVLRAAMWLSPKSLWGDEWFSVGLALRPFGEVFWGSIQDVHPPLYFLALHVLIQIFGEAETVYRLISFLAGATTVVVIYQLAREFFDEHAARTVLFLTAISPYWLQSSNEIRSYALLGLAASLTLLCFIRALREPDRSLWRRAYFAAAIFAVYVEHYAWFVVGATAVALAFSSIQRRERKKLFGTLGWIFFAGAPSLALIAYQAVFREHMFESYRMKEYYSISILVKKAVGVLWHFTDGYFFSMITLERILEYSRGSFFFWVSAATAFVASVLSPRALLNLFFESRVFFILGVTLLFFPSLFLLALYPIRLDARYLSFAAPLFFVLLGSGLSRVRNFWLRILLLALLSCTAMVGSAQAIWLRTDSAHKEDYQGLIQYVFSNTESEDVVTGLSGQVRYYRKRLAFADRAIVIPELGDLTLKNTRTAHRVWVLDQLNMHDAVWQRNYEQIKSILDGLGFRPARGPSRYGGEEGLVVSYLFERK